MLTMQLHSVLPGFILAGAVFFVTGIQSPALGQVNVAAAEFQTIQPHSYVHALGNATVAARGYPGAIGVNPATIGTQGAVRVGSNVNLRRGPLVTSPWIFPEFWITAPSGSMKLGQWAVGVQVKHFSRSTTEFGYPQGGSPGEVSVFEQSIKLAGAYDLTPGLAVGGGINVIRARLPSVTSEEVDTHPTIDLGLHYQKQIDGEVVALRPALGLSLTDFGANISYKDAERDYAAPTMVRMGGGLEATSTSYRYGRPEWRIGVYGAFSNLLVNGEWVEQNGIERFEVDGPFKSLITGWKSTIGVATGPGEWASVDSWERLTKHAGVEMAVLDILSMRLGRYHESDDNGGRQYTALGFGLDAYYVAIDASWTLGDQPFQDYSFGRVILRIPLSESPQNFWRAILDHSAR